MIRFVDIYILALYAPICHFNVAYTLMFYDVTKANTGIDV